MLRQDERTYIRRASRDVPDNEHDFAVYSQPSMQGDERTEDTMPKRTSWHTYMKHWYIRGVTVLEGTWARYLLLVGLALSTVLLFSFTGGIPPWAWRFLAQVLPQFPALLASQGTSAALALAGLLLLSFSLFVLWVIAIYCWVLLLHAFWLAFRSWRQYRHQTRQAQVFAEVQMTHLYEQGIQQKEQEALEQEQQWEREEWEQTAQLRAHTSGVIRGRRKAQENAPLGLDDEDDEDDGGEVEMDERGDGATNNNDGEDEDDVTYTYTTTPTMTALYSADATHGRPVPVLETRNQITSYAVSTGSDPGKLRKNAPNEDSTLAIQGACDTSSGPQPVGLFVVADGMGGHADGQVASRLAVQVMGDVMLPLLMNKAQEPEVFLESLKDAVHRANLAIYQRNREREHMMGTTLTSALVVGSTAHIVNAGDSRTYIYRVEDGLKQVTRDHSSVARLVEAGAIEPDDIYVHPLRNQIYRCLGDHATLQVDTFEISLEVGDSLLLCSDGLWEMVRDPDIASILKDTHMHPTIARDELIQAALDGGGADNVSVIVATVQ